MDFPLILWLVIKCRGEVYSHTLCQELSRLGHEIFIFTRIENEFLESYEVIDEVVDSLRIRRINKPKDYSYNDKFYDENIDEAFRQFLEEVQPDIVHFGHICHLSINLLAIAKAYHKRIVYTIHDFWLFCVKGQLINEKMQICSAPSIESCKQCSPYKPKDYEVRKNLLALARMRECVDIFIAPSHTVRDFFIQNGINPAKIHYQKYGFNTESIHYTKRIFNKDSIIRFAFMGRIIPTKGIRVLLEAFDRLCAILSSQTTQFQDTLPELKIYGSYGYGVRRLSTNPHIHFMGGYENAKITTILQDIDVLIVPSIWLENAPLVIQEAFLAGCVVVTSNIGGMKELVSENEGFLFEVGNAQSLCDTLLKIVKNPKILNAIPDNRHKVVSIQEDSQRIIQIYQNLLGRDSPTLHRITIDTNPDTCNFKCQMCDTHSIYNTHFVKSRPDMDRKLLQEVLRQAKNLGVKEIIPTTMGEPTLYKYFDVIVDFCLQHYIKLNLTTNGSQLFSKKYPQSYIQTKLLKVLSDIKISFNSLDSVINEDIMRGTQTTKILESIQRLCVLRDSFAPQVSITLQMTFMKKNMLSIESLVQQALKWGINRIKGHQLWITHKELESQAIYKDKESVQEWNALTERLKQYRPYIVLENFTPLDSDMQGTQKGDCPFLGRELWINYRGDISVCCAPDKERATLGDFGNLTKQNLSDVLTSNAYRKLCRDYKEREVCKQCLMRK